MANKRTDLRIDTTAAQNDYGPWNSTAAEASAAIPAPPPVDIHPPAEPMPAEVKEAQEKERKNAFDVSSDISDEKWGTVKAKLAQHFSDKHEFKIDMNKVDLIGRAKINGAPQDVKTLLEAAKAGGLDASRSARAVIMKAGGLQAMADGKKKSSRPMVPGPYSEALKDAVNMVEDHYRNKGSKV